MPLQIPTTGHLSRMYFELSKIGAACVGSAKPWPYKPKEKEELIALAADMSRFDPRLLNILVAYFIDRWKELNPLKLRSCYHIMKTPQTIAVICEFLQSQVPDEEALFFIQYLLAGLEPQPTQFYFHNLYTPGGRLAERAAEEGIYEYKKWGFLASERPLIDLAQKKCVGSFDPVSRRNILQRLLKEKDEISLNDYLTALKHSVSRQQALIDIRSSKLAKHRGTGRGARWKLAV